MILKSMSRKEPSFGQLVTYMSDEKSDRSFDLHQGLFERDPDAIAHEFEINAQHLRKRKNGNYLYHEVLSIDTRECGQSRDIKEALRLVALEYVRLRCPNNLVYGALHQDHEEHLHYHLMISANSRGERNRLRLTKAQFDRVKRDTETLLRQRFPELKQTELINSDTAEKEARRKTRESRNAQEMQKRGARLSKTEDLAQKVQEIIARAGSLEEFHRLLKAMGYTFYERGKHCGIKPIPQEGDTKKRKPHRFATLGIDSDYQAFLARIGVAPAGEKEKGGDDDVVIEELGDGGTQSADNEVYVKYDSNTDLKNDPNSQQKPDDPKDQSGPEKGFAQEMKDLREARTKAKLTSSKGRSRKR